MFHLWGDIVLSDIHEKLRELVYREGKIDSSQVDIEFEVPLNEWVASLTRPTINFFLFDLVESTGLRQMALEPVRSTSQSSTRRLPPRRFDLIYQVTVVSSDTRDSHELLWRVLGVLLRKNQIPAEFTPAAVQAMSVPLMGRVAQPEDNPKLRDLWSSFGAPPRPSLLFVLTAPIDMQIEFEDRLVLTRRADVGLLGVQGSFQSLFEIGGIVLDSKGQPVKGATIWRENSAAAGTHSDDAGHFVLSGVPPGVVPLRVALNGGAPVRYELRVPSPSYEIVLK